MTWTRPACLDDTLLGEGGQEKADDEEGFGFIEFSKALGAVITACHPEGPHLMSTRSRHPMAPVGALFITINMALRCAQ